MKRVTPQPILPREMSESWHGALLRLLRQVGREGKEGVLIDMPLSRQDLAEMSGTTLFTVSRTLKDWEALGVVKLGRARVTVTNPDQLSVIAEDL